jgi:hypothetical protein
VPIPVPTMPARDRPSRRGILRGPGDLYVFARYQHVEAVDPAEAVAGCGRRCAVNHCQPRLLLVAELAPIADTGAGDPGICNGP